MKPILTFTLIAAMFATCAFGQSSKLYVFKNERKEHLEAARRERANSREKKVSNDFYMRVRTQTSTNTAMMQIDMKRAHDAVVRVTDMNGVELATVHSGELTEGLHEFKFEPEGSLRKPFVCQLMIDGKTEAMKVVKFNSF